jgi:hypothetical protein
MNQSTATKINQDETITRAIQISMNNESLRQKSLDDKVEFSFEPITKDLLWHSIQILYRVNKGYGYYEMSEMVKRKIMDHTNPKMSFKLGSTMSYPVNR